MENQPTPTQGAASVTRQLMALLQAREERGIATYGRSLETFNGRSAPQDLVEELVDAAQYALQWQLEREEMLTRFGRIGAILEDIQANLANNRTIYNNMLDRLSAAHALTEGLRTST